MEIKKYGEIETRIFATRREMGENAADDAHKCITRLLAEKPEINCIFAAAPSQSDFISALLEKDIPWSRINVFHMDEYVGLSKDHAQSFGHFLTEAIWGQRNFKSMNYLDGTANPEAECQRYTRLMANFPPDIVFLGIGENGHIAFNDPPVADFNDPYLVKKVVLEDACKTQQVNDQCFATFDDVPCEALTLTIPALMKGRHLFCMVPGERKAQAVADTLQGEISVRCPASILRTHSGCRMYLDQESAAMLDL